MTASHSLTGSFFAVTCTNPEVNLGSADSNPRFVAARSATNESIGSDVDFQQLVETHYEALFRFGLSLTRTEHDAADLVQDTFLSWAAKGHQLLDHRKVKSWLFTTLHRRFLEGHRRSTRFPQIELSVSETELPNIEPQIVNQLDAQTVLELLAQVEPQYRAAVSLFYLEDYSYLEIASILEVPLGTVKSRIARGLTQLKELVLKRAPLAINAGKEAR